MKSVNKCAKNRDRFRQIQYMYQFFVRQDLRQPEYWLRGVRAP